MLLLCFVRCYVWSLINDCMCSSLNIWCIWDGGASRYSLKLTYFYLANVMPFHGPLICFCVCIRCVMYDWHLMWWLKSNPEINCFVKTPWQFKRPTLHVPNLIPSVKHIKRLNQLSSTCLIWVNPWIKIEWPTWEVWLWNDFISNAELMQNLMRKLLNFF